MVKYADIHKLITRRIKSKFNNIVFSTDIEEGIIRPSFFIDFDNIKASDFMNEALDRELTVRIYYFSKEKQKNKVELLSMEDDLTELFLKDNILQINEFTKVEIEELEFDVVDKVLHCYFDIMLSEDYDRIDDTPVMEDLQYEI